jgi:hypothetical protein
LLGNYALLHLVAYHHLPNDLVSRVLGATQHYEQWVDDYLQHTCYLVGAVVDADNAVNERLSQHPHESQHHPDSVAAAAPECAPSPSL